MESHSVNGLNNFEDNIQDKFEGRAGSSTSSSPYPAAEMDSLSRKPKLIGQSIGLKREFSKFAYPCEGRNKSSGKVACCRSFLKYKRDSNNDLNDKIAVDSSFQNQRLRNSSAEKSDSVNCALSRKSPEATDLDPKGKVTLWQFLLQLLVDRRYTDLIHWTNKAGEFVLLEAEEVARLWGIRKDNNHRMNYDKLSRALRYYYQKNIIRKVHGHKFVYQFIGLDKIVHTVVDRTEQMVSPKTSSTALSKALRSAKFTSSTIHSSENDENLPSENRGCESDNKIPYMAEGSLSNISKSHRNYLPNALGIFSSLSRPFNSRQKTSTVRNLSVINRQYGESESSIQSPHINDELNDISKELKWGALIEKAESIKLKCQNFADKCSENQLESLPNEETSRTEKHGEESPRKDDVWNQILSIVCKEIMRRFVRNYFNFHGAEAQLALAAEGGTQPILKKNPMTSRPQTPHCNCSCHEREVFKIDPEIKLKGVSESDSILTKRLIENSNSLINNRSSNRFSQADCTYSNTSSKEATSLDLHYQRHLANMNRLKEQIRLQSLDSRNVGERGGVGETNTSVRMHDPASKKQSRYSQDGNSSFSTVNGIVRQGAEADKFDNMFKISDSCVWMPFQKEMFSQWISILAEGRHELNLDTVDSELLDSCAISYRTLHSGSIPLTDL